MRKIVFAPVLALSLSALAGGKPVALVGNAGDTGAVRCDVTNVERIRTEEFEKGLPANCRDYAAVVFCGKPAKGVDPETVDPKLVPPDVKTIVLDGISALRIKFLIAKQDLSVPDDKGESVITPAGEAVRDLTEKYRTAICALDGLDRSLPPNEWDTKPLGAPGTLAYPKTLAKKPVFRPAPVRKPGLVLHDATHHAVIVVDTKRGRLYSLACELAYHLKAICGADFKIVQAAKETDAQPVIHITFTGGELGRSEISQKGNRLVIGGEGNGVNHALTYFLEALGCRYLFPGKEGKVIPKRKDLVAPEVALDYVPQLKIRRIRLYNAMDAKGLMRFGIDADKFLSHYAKVELDAPQNRSFLSWHGINDGDNTKGGYAWGHYFGDYWDRFGKTHPEFFALQANGSREQVLGDRAERPSLCLSSEGLARQAAEDIVRDFAKYPNLLGHSICLPDGGYMGQCMCEGCRRLDPVNAPSVVNHTCSPLWRTFPYVALTDRVLTFDNRVAELLNEKLPGKKLCTYVYSYYSKPPTAVKPHPSLVLLTVVGNYTGPNRETELQENVAAWGVYGNEMLWRPNGLQGYRVNLPQNFSRCLFNDLELMKANNLIGTDFDCFKKQYALAGLTYYMLARGHLNMDRLDYDTMLADYYEKGFGPAAAAMRAYDDYVASVGERSLGKSHNDYAAAFDLERATALMAAARTAAASDPEALARVAFFAKGLLTAPYEKKLAAAVVSGDKKAKAAAQCEYFAFIRDHALENAIAFHPVRMNSAESPNMRGCPLEIRNPNPPVLGVSTGKMRAVAHRGLHGRHVAQNSIASFEAAWKAGAKWIETDFHQLANGRLLCVHDRKELKRLSGVDREIASLTETDVASIDIGKQAHTPEPVHMPYVEDVLRTVPRDCVAQCEIKLYGDTYADTFDAARRAAGLSETNILVSSFMPAAVKDFKRRYPKYRTLLLKGQDKGGGCDIDDLLATARDAKVDYVCPGAYLAMNMERVDAERIRDAGFELRLFGVNTPEQLAKAKDLGVTAFTTDNWKLSFEWAKAVSGLNLIP